VSKIGKVENVDYLRLTPNINRRIQLIMKRKVFSVLFALVMVLSMGLMTAAPAMAATAVTDVWVQFTEANYNINHASTAVAAGFTVHFTPTSDMSRGVDTITVWVPDGSTDMGPAAFTLASANTTMANYTVDRDGEASAYSATACTSAATLSTTGFRITVTTPVDLDAGSACSFKIAAAAAVKTSASTSSTDYHIKVYTSQDTTPVLSDGFDLDDDPPGAPVLALSPTTAGSAGQYTFTMTLGTELAAGVGTVTVIFPYGTTVPSSISADNVSCQNNDGNWEACTVAPVVNQKARTVTITTPVLLAAAASQRVRFATGANIVNPTTVQTDARTDCYVSTSAEEQFIAEADGYNVTAGIATKIGFNNDAYPDSYSDSATMINMYSSILYVQSQDAYGNLKHVTTGDEPTVSFASSNASTGIFYDAVDSQISSKLLVDGKASIYYRDTTAGEVTLTASATGYTSGTWTMTIADGVSLYDSNDNLIKTFAPTWASGTDEETDVHSGDYIQNAINAAVTGDTVKLGGTADAPAIYELDKWLTLNKKITLTSATSAAYTTIRPATEPLNTQSLIATDIAVVPGITGTAANPVIIDGLTFTRLRADKEFDQAIFNNECDYVTVRNCVFDYIIPDNEADNERGSVVGFILHPDIVGGGATSITSGAISNNTFTNCCPFAAPSGEAAVICVMTKDTAHVSTSITGVTVSGNTLTNCNGIAITINGYRGVTAEGTTEAYITADVTDNILTNPVIGIDIQRQTHSTNVLRNTVTGAYCAALYVETYDTSDHDNLVIKNNTFTGAAGADKTYFTSMSGAVVIEADGSTGVDTGANTVQYNAIYDNDADYSIYVASNIGAQDCKYNYFGDATGPAYTALTGATVSKSNTGGAGKKVSDYVTYYPWLHKSLADVVVDNASYQASTMSLVAGWNTLSTPVKLIAAADAIDELIPAHMTVGYYYDATATVPGWQQITTGKVLSPCDAVYVKMSIATDVLLKFDASAWTMPSKDLAAGWNLCSLAYLASAGKSDYATVASVVNTADNLPGYSQLISPSLNATQTDMYGRAGTSWAYAYGETAPADRTGVNTCYAGLGYWIYMQNAATLAGFEITPIAPDLD